MLVGILKRGMVTMEFFLFLFPAANPPFLAVKENHQFARMRICKPQSKSRRDLNVQSRLLPEHVDVLIQEILRILAKFHVEIPDQSAHN